MSTDFAKVCKNDLWGHLHPRGRFLSRTAFPPSAKHIIHLSLNHDRIRHHPEHLSEVVRAVHPVVSPRDDAPASAASVSASASASPALVSALTAGSAVSVFLSCPPHPPIIAIISTSDTSIAIVLRTTIFFIRHVNYSISSAMNFLPLTVFSTLQTCLPMIVRSPFTSSMSSLQNSR